MLATLSSCSTSVLLLRLLLFVSARPTCSSSGLHGAAERNDAAAVLAALVAGGNPNARDADSYTPLHLSAGMGSGNALSALLADARTDAEATDDVGETALHLAAAAGRLEAVRQLLAHGVRVDAASHEGYTPLHMAAQHGELDAARLLLEAGASPRAESRALATPLHWAAHHSNAEVFMLLLAKGGQLQAKDASGTTPLALVSENGDPEFNAKLQQWVAAEKARRAEEPIKPREEL